jgi:hypothetical protein
MARKEKTFFGWHRREQVFFSGAHKGFVHIFVVCCYQGLQNQTEIKKLVRTGLAKTVNIDKTCQKPAKK